MARGAPGGFGGLLGGMMLELDEKTPFGVIKLKSNMCIALRMIKEFERRRKAREIMDYISVSCLLRH